MGFFGFFSKKAVVSGGSAAKSSLCVVDLASMMGSSGVKNGRIHPRDNFLTLRNLSQLVAREEFEMVAVITGRELKEVKEGQAFKGVKVYYAEDPTVARSKVLDVARKHAGKHPVVVTSDAETEKKIFDAGFSCMRPATIKKAGMPEENDQNSRQRNNGQKRQGERRRKKPEQQQAEAEVEDPEILTLIDPV